MKGVTADHRAVKPGMIFVAVKGRSFDGHDVIDSAVKAGAVKIIGERPKAAGLKVDYEQVPSSRKRLAELASEFAGHPSRALCMLGVTGTSGKTSVTFILEHLLKAAGRNVGVIGTVNVRYADKVIEATHTTPDPVALQKLLGDMRAAGVDTVVMEVSSHALDQDRVWGLAFDSVGFTNLSPEHLDYHPDMEAYFQAKRLLFTDYLEAAKRAGKRPQAHVITESDWGRRLEKEVPGSAVKDVTWPSPLRGEFNRKNVSLAVAMARGLAVGEAVLKAAVADIPAIPGRLEPVPNARGIQVFVDYAHKPDALEKVLRVLRPETSGRLICVFGCGGDRDREKRPLMGGIAERLADLVWVTSDNPRTEDPSAIIREILAGTQAGLQPGSKKVRVESDRRKAITAALAEARAGDTVLIAGKGHETYQIVGATKTPFDDRVVASEILSRPG